MEVLPRELVSNVLSRLPGKELNRCKCVCRSWLDIITDPLFISSYCVSYNSQEEKLLVIRSDDSFDTVTSILSWNPNEPKGLVSSHLLNHPPPYQYKFWCLIMGPCNGIYFLYGCPNIIMNPSLGHFIALPLSHFTAPDGTHFLRDYPFFGFDPETNDYKVLVLRDLWTKETNELLLGDWRVELYSLNSKSWRNLGPNPIPFPFATTDLSVLCPYVNNCCHRLGFVHGNKDVDVIENLVLSFDMVTELFRKIKVPQITHSFGQASINLIAFTESATIGFVAYPVSQGTETRSCFDVWMMKDYWDDGSWIKQYSIGPLPVIYKQLVGFCGGNRFLWKDANNRLVLYDPHSEGQTRYLTYCDGQTRDLRVSTKVELTSAAKYLESPVSLKRGNQSSSHK